jgi:hypothetical protein
MAVGFSNTNKPLNPRGQDASPKGYNRAALFSGKALDFDGVNDNLDLDGFTLSGTTATICFNGLVTGSNRYFFWVGGKNYGVINHDTLGFGIFDSATWNYFGTTQRSEMNSYCVINEGTTQRVYCNGVQIGSDATATAIDWSSPSKVLLGSNNAENEFLNGQIAGFKIFNTALTAEQVADLYDNPEKVVPTGVDNTALKLWLPMMEGAGTTAYDGSGNGNHGTISGATYVNGIGAPSPQSAVMDWNKGSNLVTYSEDFSQWGTNDSPVVTASSTIAPDGSTNAADVTASGNNAFARVKSPTISMAGDYVGSFYLKKTTGAVTNYPGFDIGGPGHYVLVDTTNGTAQSTGGSYTDILVTSYNETWWRVSAKINTTTTDNAIRLWPALSNNPSSIQSYVAGTATFWGAQVEQADTLGPYIPTLATAQTSEVLLPQGLTTGRDITGVNLFENVRKQGALNLDGNSWAEVHDNESLDITDAITLEAWVYWDGSSVKGILGRWHNNASNRNYLLYKLSATNISFYINSNNLINQSGLTATKGWTHIVGTYNRTNAVLYIDGVQQATAAHTTAISTGTLPVEIGRNFTTSSQALTTPIAQPRIYNRALTASEVLRNYNSGKNTYTND